MFSRYLGSDAQFGNGSCHNLGQIRTGAIVLLNSCVRQAAVRAAPQAAVQLPSESQAPAKRGNQQTKIARVTNEPINSAGDENVSRLDRDKTTEALAEHKYGRQPQHAANHKQDDAHSANSLVIYRSEFLTITESRKITVQQPDHRKGSNHLPVATIFANSRAQISAGEQSNHGHRQQYDKERRRAAPVTSHCRAKHHYRRTQRRRVDVSPLPDMSVPNVPISNYGAGLAERVTAV